MSRDENLDIALLRLLDANNTPFGLGPTALAHLLGMYGLKAGEDEIRKRLFYLGDDSIGFVAVVDKKDFHPENATWRISARGTNHLREHGY